MEKSNTAQASYRYGEYGPGYLLRGPRTDIGVVRLRPGDSAPNHYHAQLEETFIVLEGEASMWLNCTEKFTLQQGDVYRCDPEEMHFFVNESTTNFRALFIKAPYDPADAVQVPWTPGEPVPDPLPRLTN